jgi:hypothetical protein
VYVSVIAPNKTAHFLGHGKFTPALVVYMMEKLLAGKVKVLDRDITAHLLKFFGHFPLHPGCPQLAVAYIG